jgi:hypothetical protein
MLLNKDFGGLSLKIIEWMVSQIYVTKLNLSFGGNGVRHMMSLCILW